MSKARFEIINDIAGVFRVRFKAGNGEVLFSSGVFFSKGPAKSAIEYLQKNAADADVVEVKR